MTTPRPVPGAPLSGPRLRQPSNGTCPTCAQPVLWARDHTHGADGSAWHAPLDPKPFAFNGAGFVMVAPSTSGALAAVTPEMYRPHYCSDEAVEALLARVGSLGFYTADVLAVGCPLNVCGAAPGMMCVDSRRDAMSRPHGARQVLSENREYREHDLTE